MTTRMAVLLGVCLLVFGAYPSIAAPAKPSPADLPARIDLYDAKTGKIYLVVYYAQMSHEPGGAVRFVKPRAIVLAREGKNLDEMIESPVAEITGATGLYDPARQTLHVDEAQSVFHTEPAASQGEDHPVTVVSRRLDVFPDESRAVYEERVRLVRGEMTLLCDRLTARWDPTTKKLKTAQADGQPAVVTRRNGERLEAARIDVDLAGGKAMIPAGVGGRASFLAPGIFREGGENQ